MSFEPRLNLVVIRARDLERAAQFYGALGLAFEKHRHGKGAEHYASVSESLVFEIYPQQAEAQSTSATRIGFLVRSVDAAVAHLAGQGASVISAPQDSPWGRRAVVTDPDGHRVELTERKE